MKSYLIFNIEGDIIEFKTNTILNHKDLNYSNQITINHDNFLYLIFYNNNFNHKLNLCKLVFINFDIYGNYLIFKLDKNHNLKNFTLKQALKLTSNLNQFVFSDYSSDEY